MATAAMTFSDLPKAIKRPLTIGEVAAIADIDRKAVNRMIDDGVLPKSFLLMRKAPKDAAVRRFLKPSACPMVLFNATTGSLISARMRARVFKKIDLMIREDMTASVLEEGVLSLDLSKILSEALDRMLALARAEADVEVDAEKRGGVPVLCGTRVMVYELADLAEQETLEDILAAFPSLTAERVENAKIYAKAHPLNGRPKKSTGLPEAAQKISSTKIDLSKL